MPVQRSVLHSFCSERKRKTGSAQLPSPLEGMITPRCLLADPGLSPPGLQATVRVIHLDRSGKVQLRSRRPVFGNTCDMMTRTTGCE